MRYIAAAYVLHQKRLAHIGRDLVHVLKSCDSEASGMSSYGDAMTRFVQVLHDMAYEFGIIQVSVAGKS